MLEDKYDFLIVGSGAGGATLARELSKKGRAVLVLERGKDEKKVGRFRDALRYFDVSPLTQMPRQSREGVVLWRALMAGGSTVVSCGNALRCLQDELAELGLELEEEFQEAEAEMEVGPVDERLLSEGSERILWASRELGYEMELMPKLIDAEKCRKCGQCTMGCAPEAKWTARAYLEEAEREGAEIAYETRAERVLVDNGAAKGISAIGPGGEFAVEAGAVVLAAGGLGTPVILQRSGLTAAGERLFVDLMVNTYGTTEGLNLVNEPKMALVDREFHDSEGFYLAPYVNHPRMARAIELGASGFALPTTRLIGVMTETADEAVGRVYPDGSVSKPVTEKDRRRLDAGSTIAREILTKAGADPKSIVVSKPQGAHPGGTAAIDKIVDRDLQTEINNLFVCDASVFPTAPGTPPILTIAALAKRLAKTLA